MENHKKYDSAIYRSTTESSKIGTGHFLPSPSHLTGSSRDSRSRVSIKSAMGLSSTEKIQYIVKNQVQLGEEYKQWVQKQKERIRNTFERGMEEIYNTLRKSERVLENILDCLYQDALVTLQQIKSMAKTMFMHRSPLRSKSISNNQLQYKNKYRNKNNGKLIDDILSQQSEIYRSKKVKNYYENNRDQFQYLYNKAENFLNISDQTLVKNLQELFNRVKEQIKLDVEIVNREFSSHVKEKRQKQWKQSWKQKTKGISQYGF